MPTSSPTTIQALALAAHSAAIARTGGLRAAALRAYDAARIPPIGPMMRPRAPTPSPSLLRVSTPR